MEDTRREREVAQGLGIIVQHIISISLDPDNADMLPRRCRLRVAPRGTASDSSSRESFENHHDAARLPRPMHVPSIRGTVNKELRTPG